MRRKRTTKGLVSRLIRTVLIMKTKLKPLLPTLKEKKRYLAFEVISNSHFSYDEVAKAINTSSLEFLGVLGLSKAGIQVLEPWNSEKMRGIIRVNTNYVDHLKSSLLFIQKIKDTSVNVKSVGVSGMIDKAKTRYLA